MLTLENKTNIEVLSKRNFVINLPNNLIYFISIISMTIHNAKDIILVCYEFFEIVEIK